MGMKFTGFVKVVLEITKTAQHYVLLIHIFSCLFEITPSLHAFSGL